MELTYSSQFPRYTSEAVHGASCDGRVCGAAIELEPVWNLLPRAAYYVFLVFLMNRDRERSMAICGRMRVPRQRIGSVRNMMIPLY